METNPCKRPVGRPRAFCTASALDRALAVFWRKGYEGTTLPDLTAAMGINRPSLYAAYGNKEQLFRKALARYLEVAGTKMACALGAPTAREVAERVLSHAAAVDEDPQRPRGCLLVQGALAAGDEAEPVRQELGRCRQETERLLRLRFEQAAATGELASSADAANLARFIATVLEGMAVRNSAGATATELRSVAETALRAWPA